jgi:prevent-host-death family protein
MDMTRNSVSLTQARANLSEILGRVKFGEDIVTVEKKGKPYAVIISPKQYETYQKAAKEKLFALSEKMQSRNTEYSKEEVMQDVTEAVEAVRQERYDQSQ